MHAAVQALPPDLVIDAHEFSVAQRWIEKFGGLQADRHDAAGCDASDGAGEHPATGRGVFQPAIEAAVAAARA